MKHYLVYSMLVSIRTFSAAFYRFNIQWIGKMPPDPWANLRLVLLMNHTSLYEPLFAGFLPKRFLRNIAFKGIVPVADKTINRPMVGQFFRRVAGNVVSVSRARDHTWHKFLAKIKPDSLVIMAPEGRMKRANGLDSEGRKMTVRGGVADLLRAIPGGRMLIAYSGGLHHIQVPNQLIPKPFKTLHMKIENLDIAAYRDAMLHRYGTEGFKGGVILDLENRRDAYCPA
jgi:1-acyl-sn-glycerol-3-phosphate acyltransferase